MKPQNLNKKEQKSLTLKNAVRNLRGGQRVLNGFASKILPMGKQTQEKEHPLDIARVGKVSDRLHLKILTPKQMVQRLPTALAQVTASNGPENLLNEIRQIIYSLYQAKEIKKIVHNNIMSSIKL